MTTSNEHNNAPAVPQGEQIKKALGKLKAAQMCHPNSVQFLIEEAIDALEATPAPAPAQEVGLTDEAVNAAAKVLAERFDYPWEHMPEEGRKNMRAQARAVVEAALRAKGGK